MADVQTKVVDAMTVMSLSFTGPYEQTSDKTDELMSWMLRVGHPYCGAPLGLYYDDPRQVAADDLRAEACLPIEEECEPTDDVERKVLPAVTVAYAVHTGRLDQLAGLYEEIFAWMTENGHQHVEGAPTREVFLQIHGQGEDPEEWVVEVQVPIEQA